MKDIDRLTKKSKSICSYVKNVKDVQGIKSVAEELAKEFALFTDILKMFYDKIQKNASDLGKYKAAVAQANRSVKEYNDKIEKDSSDLGAYEAAVAQANRCALVFKNWKRSSQDRVKKRFIEYLEKDKCVSSAFVEKIKELKQLVYAFRKLDSDLERLAGQTGYECFDVVAPCADKMIHAELKILFTLAGQNYFDESHRVHRIGISKLCCLMCQSVVETFNKIYQKLDDGRDLITIRWWHGKRYNNWRFPSCIEIKSKDNVLNIWELVLQTICRKYQQGYLLSENVFNQKDGASTATTSSSGSSETQFTKQASKLSEHQALKIIKNLKKIQDDYPKCNFKILDDSIYIQVGEKHYTSRELPGEHVS